jgi:hypothetical protein
MDTVQFDSHGWWDAANKRYVPKRAGKYLVTYDSASSCSGAGPIQVFAAIYLNGNAATSRGVSWNGVTYLPYTNMVYCNTIMSCNGSTDYIEPWLAVNGTGAQIPGGYAQMTITHLGP